MLFNLLYLYLYCSQVSQVKSQYESEGNAKIKINSDELGGGGNIRIKINQNEQKDCDLKLNDTREIPQQSETRLLHTSREHGKEEVKHTALDQKDCGTEEKILAPKWSEKVETYTVKYAVTQIKSKTLTRRRKFFQRQKHVIQKINKPELIIKRQLVNERQTFERIIPKIIETRIVVNNPYERVQVVTGPVEEVYEEGITPPGIHIRISTEGYQNQPIRIGVHSSEDNANGLLSQNSIFAPQSEQTKRIVVNSENQGLDNWSGETHKIKINTNGGQEWGQSGETQRIAFNAGLQDWPSKIGHVVRHENEETNRIVINTGNQDNQVWNGETQKIRINTNGEQNANIQGISIGGGLQDSYNSETHKIKINTNGGHDWGQPSGGTQRIVVNSGDQNNYDSVVPPEPSRVSPGVALNGNEGLIKVKTRSIGHNSEQIANHFRPNSIPIPKYVFDGYTFIKLENRKK